MALQLYKSLYFSDFPADNSKSKAKAITIAFNSSEKPYFQKIKGLSNQEIRELIGVNTYNQLFILSQNEERSINNIIKRLLKDRISIGINPQDTTFAQSKNIPFQRWYPYIEGYSPEYVSNLIKNYLNNNVKTIYDPFIGTGTTIFSADEFNKKTVYSEINPMLQFLIDTKITVLKSDFSIRETLSRELLEISNKLKTIFKENKEDLQLKQNYKILFGTSEYFDDNTFKKILSLRTFLDKLRLSNVILSDLVTVAVTAILISVSLLKKNGDLRFKTQDELIKEKCEITEELSLKLKEISEDISNLNYNLTTTPLFLISNSKNIGYLSNLNIDAVITSPPYLNGTNYFRNTKLELWFLRYISYENDLRYLRNQALTSGINDVTNCSMAIIDDEVFTRSKLLKKCYSELRKNAYDKRIPLMVNNYFSEMLTVFKELTVLLSSNAKVFIDIGDSIFCGIHIPTDDILIEILDEYYELIEKKEVRKRRSKNNMLLRQSLLILKLKKKCKLSKSNQNIWLKNWNYFKTNLPHQSLPFSKKTWGHPNHSLCSYQGKLKPSIAHHLVKTFIPEGGKMLDPFAGVGTIPFEAALKGCYSYGIDISISAYYIAKSKVSLNNQKLSMDYLNKMTEYITNNKCSKDDLDEVKIFGFNKKIIDYYEENTLKEIILARKFSKEYPPKNSSEMLVISSLLHILHGNRPYALSRRSHPIVPYAPKGDFIYKNVIQKLNEKLIKYFNQPLPLGFIQGEIFYQDSTLLWPQEIQNLDAIITSPPFFDSTRFYLANWLRIWFAGWTPLDFDNKINAFIEEKQKKDFSIYENIFRQSRERLKKNGVLVLHLGKSKKCDMAEELLNISKYWFKKADLFSEDVAHCASFGIRDIGTVTSHQYLILN
jgi:tRNA G10  N-methylase Trm11